MRYRQFLEYKIYSLNFIFQNEHSSIFSTLAISGCLFLQIFLGMLFFKAISAILAGTVFAQAIPLISVGMFFKSNPDI
jgi:hypothetical protein